MDAKEIYIPREWAETIAQMAEVCFGEGIGPDSSLILRWIAEHYPDVRECYKHSTYWPADGNSDD